MVTKTLIGLACLIANKGPAESERLMQTLPTEDQHQAQAVINTGVCLPDTFETLLIETQRKVEKGVIPKHQPMAGPSDGCFSP